MWLSQSLEDQKIWSGTTNYTGCIIHKPSGLVVACCQVIPVKVLPLKRWLIRHPNLLKYEREYSKILVTNFVASDEIASFKPTSKCRFCQDIPVKVLPLKRWLIRHPNLLKYEREYSKILVTNFVASDEIASFKPTSKCRFWRWIHVTFLDDISHHTCLALFPRRA